MIGYLAMVQMDKIRTKGSTLKPFESTPEPKPFSNHMITPSYHVYSRDPTKRINTHEPSLNFLATKLETTRDHNIEPTTRMNTFS